MRMYDKIIFVVPLFNFSYDFVLYFLFTSFSSFRSICIWIFKIQIYCFTL